MTPFLVSHRGQYVSVEQLVLVIPTSYHQQFQQSDLRVFMLGHTQGSIQRIFLNSVIFLLDGF